MRGAEAGPTIRASTLVLRMNSVARQVCLSGGGGHLGINDGVMCMLDILRNYFPPGGRELDIPGSGSRYAISSGGPND